MGKASNMWILIYTLVWPGKSGSSSALTTPTTLKECQGYLLDYAINTIKNAEIISSEVVYGTFPDGIIIATCVPML